ncbi:MAG: GNAT family N-acetyltransferase [Gemmatimonadaceae bacterium]
MIEINEEQSLNELEIRRIHDGLVATDPVNQPRHYAPLFLSLRDPDLRLVGGVLASTVWNWLSIDALWVNQELRGQGYGSRLVAQAEQVARKRGCTHARLDTFDYQARAFYERLGYSVYAQLEGFPEGHAQLHMTKLLPSAS